MQSESAMLRGYIVAAPRPNRVPKPGTLELCQIRAWFSMATIPNPRMSFCWMWFHSLSSVAPQREEGRRDVDDLAALEPFDERLIARPLHQSRHAVDRPIEA